MKTQAPDSPARHREPQPASIGATLMASFGAIMMALAAGALWLLLILAIPRLHAETWLALPLAVVLGPLIRGWIIDDAWPAALLAALAMLLSAFYMRALLVASDLAGSFGMDFMQALRHAGAGMLVHLAWLSVTPGAMAIYIAAAILAGTLAGRVRPRARARS
jgi:hypothetical protein